MDFKHVESEHLEGEMSICRGELADIIFEIFRASSDPQAKLALLEKKKKKKKRSNFLIGGPRSAKESWHDTNEFQTIITFALMTLLVGSPVEYQQILDGVVQTCVKGWTDTVGWNDVNSFRKLAKVLDCIPNLERDAQISLSCQLYITDTNVDHGDNDSDAGMSFETGSMNVSYKTLLIVINHLCITILNPFEQPLRIHKGNVLWSENKADKDSCPPYIDFHQTHITTN
jgi:hypothetical protein